MPSRTSQKPPVLETLYDHYGIGAIVDSSMLRDAIQSTGVTLGLANQANFLKDIIRSPNANQIWPDRLKSLGVTARQCYGQKRVFQFLPYRAGQTEPFPDEFPVDTNTATHDLQSVSMPFAARQLGRKDESWLTQIAVNSRLVESQLSIYSPDRERLRDVTHLQMSIKTQPEIDAAFLASYGTDGRMSSPTSDYVFISCEAKQAKQRLLPDQLREQVAKAMRTTQAIANPKIGYVKPLALQVVEQIRDGKPQNAIYAIEFDKIKRQDFLGLWSEETDEQLYSLPLDVVSKVIYRLLPIISGLN